MERQSSDKIIAANGIFTPTTVTAIMICNKYICELAIVEARLHLSVNDLVGTTCSVYTKRNPSNFDADAECKRALKRIA